MDVGFEGKNGHDGDVARCLLMTQFGHRWPLKALGGWYGATVYDVFGPGDGGGAR